MMSSEAAMQGTLCIICLVFIFLVDSCTFDSTALIDARRSFSKWLSTVVAHLLYFVPSILMGTSYCQIQEDPHSVKGKN